MKQAFKIFILIILPIWEYNSCFAQGKTDLGSWGMLILKGKINNSFSFQGELNARSDNFISNFNYCEYKGSMIYSISEKLEVALGAGGYNKNQESYFLDFKNSQQEFRIWEDILFKHALKRLIIDHRVRLEQRFLPSDYRNRLRYRLAFSVPINEPEIKEKTFYLSTYDEVYFGERNPTYEKNKFYIGAGYKLNKALAFQLGRVHIEDYAIDYVIRKNYLQLTIFYNIN